MKFSIFEPLNGKSGVRQPKPTKEVTFKQLVQYYNSNRNRELSQAIHNATKKEVKAQLKNERDYFTPYGTFSYRKNNRITHYNRVVSIDIDDLESIDHAKEVRDKLSKHPSILFCLLSVRQKGVKALMNVNHSFHYKDQYKQLKHIFRPYIADWLDIDIGHIDTAQFKISQPCFFSYDDDMYVNDDAEPLNLEFDFQEQTTTKRLKKTKEGEPYVTKDIPIYAKDNLDRYIQKVATNKIKRIPANYKGIEPRHPKLYGAKGVGELIHYAIHLKDEIINRFIEAGVSMYNDEGMRENVTHSVNDAFNEGMNNPIENDTLESIIKGSLEFSTKQTTEYTYCLLFYKELGVKYYQDNSKGVPFRGKNFLLWDDKFHVFAANSNYNKAIFENGRWRQMNEAEFTEKLKHSYLVLKHLNQDKTHDVIIEAFRIALHKLAWRSNHNFNVNYVIQVLTKQWDELQVNVNDLVRVRNWRFNAKEEVKTLKHFQLLLNADNKLHKVSYHLKLLSKLTDRMEFIQPHEIGLRDRSSEPYVWDMMKQYNNEIIGCKTSREFQNITYLNEWINEYLLVKVQKSHSPYCSLNMGCVINVLKQSKNKRSIVLDHGETIELPSYSSIMENTGCTKRNIESYFKFVRDDDALKTFKDELRYRIYNPHTLAVERNNGRLVVRPLTEGEQFEPTPQAMIEVKELQPIERKDYNKQLEYFKDCVSRTKFYPYHKTIDEKRKYVKTLWHSERMSLHYFTDTVTDAQITQDENRIINEFIAHGCISLTQTADLIAKSLEMKRKIDDELKAG